jgi:hypothetical protein
MSSIFIWAFNEMPTKNILNVRFLNLAGHRRNVTIVWKNGISGEISRNGLNLILTMDLVPGSGNMGEADFYRHLMPNSLPTSPPFPCKIMR